MKKIKYWYWTIRYIPHELKTKFQKWFIRKANSIIISQLSRMYDGGSYDGVEIEPIALINPMFAVTHIMQDKWDHAYMSLKIKGIYTRDAEIGSDELIIDIVTDRPGIIIGKGGKDIDDLKSRLESIFQRKVIINLFEK